MLDSSEETLTTADVQTETAIWTEEERQSDLVVVKRR